ncbi:hypothetical protein BsWGS_09717 [Bradybaena similaris]
MSFVFCCCRSRDLGPGHIPLKDLPQVQLDTSFTGNDVVIIKNGQRICGSGAALANAPIVQDKAYFEVKVQCTGTWGVGLAARRCNLNRIPLGNDADSWVLRQDGCMFHNGVEKGKLLEVPQEGDILGLAYDHVELNFFVNGSPVNSPLSGVKGTVYPAFYVDDGAVLDIQFQKFYSTPPAGFDSIMIEKSLL